MKRIFLYCCILATSITSIIAMTTAPTSGSTSATASASTLVSPSPVHAETETITQAIEKEAQADAYAADDEVLRNYLTWSTTVQTGAHSLSARQLEQLYNLVYEYGRYNPSHNNLERIGTAAIQSTLDRIDEHNLILARFILLLSGLKLHEEISYIENRNKPSCTYWTTSKLEPFASMPKAYLEKAFSPQNTKTALFEVSRKHLHDTACLLLNRCFLKEQLDAKTINELTRRATFIDKNDHLASILVSCFPSKLTYETCLAIYNTRIRAIQWWMEHEDEIMEKRPPFCAHYSWDDDSLNDELRTKDYDKKLLDDLLLNSRTTRQETNTNDDDTKIALISANGYSEAPMRIAHKHMPVVAQAPQQIPERCASVPLPTPEADKGNTFLWRPIQQPRPKSARA